MSEKKRCTSELNCGIVLAWLRDYTDFGQIEGSKKAMHGTTIDFNLDMR